MLVYLTPMHKIFDLNLYGYNVGLINTYTQGQCTCWLKESIIIAIHSSLVLIFFWLLNVWPYIFVILVLFCLYCLINLYFTCTKYYGYANSELGVYAYWISDTAYTHGPLMIAHLVHWPHINLLPVLEAQFIVLYNYELFNR